MYEGICLGGPISGEEYSSRFPKGFLLVDKEKKRCWIYDWDGSAFRVRTKDPLELDHEGRIRAANEYEYDVIAAPWVGAK